MNDRRAFGFTVYIMCYWILYYAICCFCQITKNIELLNVGLLYSVAGSGEHLIRTMLARECSTAMQAENAHQALLEAMQNKFISK